MQTCKEILRETYAEFRICWEAAGSSGTNSLFGVSDYLAALALLLVLYTISDYKTKLRLSLAPIPIYNLSFWLFLTVFVLKMIMEFWFYNGWPILSSLDNKLLIDAVLLVPCFLTILYWIFVSYISPPKFSRWNGRRFFWIYQRAVHNEGEEELKAALGELARSSRNLIKLAPEPPKNKRLPWKPTSTEAAAHEFLLLLGNRRICAEMACSAPNTAAAIFQEVSTQDKTGVYFHTFARNVAEQLLTNKSSPIFHEDSGWDSGWSGMAQLYSSEIFTNPKLINELSRIHHSPLEPNFRLRDKWDAENWEAYTRVALLYFQRALGQNRVFFDEFVTRQILQCCESMVHGLYHLNGEEGLYFQRDEALRLRVLVDFLRDLMKLLDEKAIEIQSSLKPRDRFGNGIHEQIAELIFDVIFEVSKVRRPIDTCWSIAHINFWSNLFNFDSTKTTQWIYRRVCKLIYAEIRRMDNFYNFKGAGYLGFSLNVLGLCDHRQKVYRSEDDPLRLAALEWMREHYERMRVESPKVADACLHGSITYDPVGLELVKTYSNETGNSPNERRFRVNPYLKE